MTLEILPRNGSIVIVDDKVEEARPLIELFSSVGCSSTYYTGIDALALPKVPVQRVRLAFFDIQFIGALDAHTYASNILQLIDRIIPTDNGPYVLVLWSKTRDGDFEEVETQVLAPAHEKKPIKVIRLSKRDYFKGDEDDEALKEFRETVMDELEGRFNLDDRMAITEAIATTQPKFEKQVLIDGSLEKITKELLKNLRVDLAPFLFFVTWENLIAASAANTTTLLSEVFDIDTNWHKNTMKLIYRLGHAQFEQQAIRVSPLELAHGALTTIHSTFSDIVESGIVESSKFDEFVDKKEMMKVGVSRRKNGHDLEVELNYLEKEYSFKIDGNRKAGIKQNSNKLNKLKINEATEAQIATFNDILAEFDKVAMEINTRLLLDSSVSNIVQPGNLYSVKGPAGWKLRKFLNTYFDKQATQRHSGGPQKGKLVLSIDELKDIDFVELEVSPTCDYAQNKWIKHRLLPGILLPIKIAEKLKVVGPATYYYQCPTIIDKGVEKRLILNYRLLKSISIEKFDLTSPILRLRKELLSDIVSQMASHVSRLGITHL